MPATSSRQRMVVYCLTHVGRGLGGEQSYVGMTNNLARRQHEHNNHTSKKGARFTRRSSNWKPRFFVTGLQSRRDAARLEIALKDGTKLSSKQRDTNPFGNSSGGQRALKLLLSLRSAHRRRLSFPVQGIVVFWRSTSDYHIATHLAWPTGIQHVLHTTD